MEPASLTPTVKMKRDLITIDDLSNQEIEDVFALADDYLDATSNAMAPHRVARRVPKENGESLEGKILASLFYEPSTRTRLSFEAAMARLGGTSLTVSGGKTTSAAKGETIADTVRVVENYADIVVLRHPCEGAARTAADLVSVPVINGGDGGHEHPTQTLCDLYTLKKEKKSLEGMSVLLTGDLKNGRTVHSLVYGLARFGAVIATAPAPGLGLPGHVSDRLKREYNCVPAPFENDFAGSVMVDAVYVTPKQPHQPTLFSMLPSEQEIISEETRVRVESSTKNIDVFYVTRIQRERGSESEDAGNGVLVIDKAFLKNVRYKNVRVLHPLPRVHELAYDIDDDPRSVYFKQAGYGVPIRMALMAKLLGVRAFRGCDRPRTQGIIRSKAWLCRNGSCITNNKEERRAIQPRYNLVGRTPAILECRYCEHLVEAGAIGRKSTRFLSADMNLGSGLDLGDVELFNSLDEGISSGYRLQPKSRGEGSPA